MKSTLTFEFPEESKTFWDHINGPQYRFALEDLDAWLRGKIKYEDLKSIDPQEVRDELYQILSDRGISIT